MFTDVPKTHWARPYIAIGQVFLIAQGYPKDGFKPDQPATRAEALTFAVRGFLVGAVLSAGMAGLAYYAATKKK